MAPLCVKTPALATVAEVAWYGHQMERLADGLEPDPHASVRWAMARYLGALAGRGIAYRPRHRSRAGVPPTGAEPPARVA